MDFNNQLKVYYIKKSPDKCCLKRYIKHKDLEGLQGKEKDKR